MNSIPKPEYKVSTVFEECRLIRKNKDLKDRLKAIKPMIDLAESEYEIFAKSGSLFKVQSSIGVGTTISTSEMESLYTEVFARKNSPVRTKYYDELILAPDHGTCPLCAHRDVSTLDHYLPKGKNPSLAVTPINLIAACQECNKIKHEHHPVLSNEQLIHPYFDKLPDEIWLIASIETTSPPAVVFTVDSSNIMDKDLAARLHSQFKKLELASLYTSNAGKTLSGISEKLVSAWTRGGSNEVEFLLNEDSRSWGKHAINSWQASMYRALAKSDWFCSEGYAYAGVKRSKKENL